MKVLLLNSNMMPKPGNYQSREIPGFDFFKKVRNAEKNMHLVNYVGYQQNIDLINKETGLNLRTNRDKTILNDGDVMLTMSLKYRINGIKGGVVNASDFVYNIVKYQDPTALSEAQQDFINNLTEGSAYNFETDELHTPDDDDWTADINFLKEVCKKELGNGYQQKIADRTGMLRQSINRVFSLKFSPSYKVLYRILKSINYSTEFKKDK